MKKKGVFASRRTCLIFRCHHPLYAVGLCNTHYTAAITNRVLVPRVRTRCWVPTCARLVWVTSAQRTPLCQLHADRRRSRRSPQSRRLRTLVTILPPRGPGTEERNPRWNGGVSDYPDHGLFKRHRKLVLAKARDQCARCQFHASIVHHKNGDKADHRLENLEPLCRGCHSIEHRHALVARPSKYRRLYGHTLDELAAKEKLSLTVLYYRLNRGWKPGTPWIPRRRGPRPMVNDHALLRRVAEKLDIPVNP